MKEPKPLKDLSGKNIKGIFFDIDDTFSSDGKITKEAYDALWKLSEAGLLTVPVTGRPAGWCDHIARMWPVTAVIGEMGAFYFMMKDGKLSKNYIWGKDGVLDVRRRLEAIRRDVMNAVPGADVASDHNYREFDMAIDFCEDVNRLSEDDMDKIVDIFKRHGANVKVSSIHINGWFGEYDKLAATKRFAKIELGCDLDKDNGNFVFCGDSPNDEPMFAFFKNGVGVRNVMDFTARLKHMPMFVTPSRSGKGFAELAEQILKK